MRAQLYKMNFVWIRQIFRSMTRLGSKVGWKWKWPEKCQKIEIILIWFISNTNNVKSCKKFNETTQTANFTGFLCYHLLNRSYCCSKSGQIWRFSLESGVVKQKYALKNFLKTDPLEKSFKIGFWKFSQEDLSWKIFWARMYFITTHNYYEKNQNFRHRWLWAAIT